MPEGDPGLRRVVCDVPADAVPGVVELLQGFAAGQEIDVQEVDAFRPAITVESARAYDPARVIWVDDVQTGRQVAVITDGHFEDFATEQDGRLLRGYRLGFALLNPDTVRFRGMRPYVQLDEEGHILGLRASAAESVLDQLRRKTMRLRNVGKATIDLLEEYIDVLFLPDDA